MGFFLMLIIFYYSLYIFLLELVGVFYSNTQCYFPFSFIFGYTEMERALIFLGNKNHSLQKKLAH